MKLEPNGLLHTGIEGNEEADKLADIAANPNRPMPCLDPLSQQPTICGIRSVANKIKRDAAQSWLRNGRRLIRRPPP